MTNIGFLDSKKEKVEFLELYDLYTKLTGDKRMLIFGMIMGMQYGQKDDEKKGEKNVTKA